MLRPVKPQPAQVQHRRAAAGVAGAAQDRAHARHHFLGVERLRHVIVRAKLQPADLVGVVDARGQHQDGDGGELFVGAHAACHIPAVAAGQHQVEHDQVRPLAAQDVQGLGAVQRGKHGEPFLAQVRFQQAYDLLIVVDDEDAGRHNGR